MRCLPLQGFLRGQGVSALYHVTQRENLGSILDEGLLARTRVQDRGIGFEDVSADGPQEIRADKETPDGRPIQDYVPLFFNPVNPFQYAVKKQCTMSDHVILGVDLSVLTQEGVFVGDGNTAGQTKLQRVEAVHDFDWDVILDRSSWDGDEEKRMRQAEALVPDRVPPKYITTVCERGSAAEMMMESRLEREARDGINAVADPDVYI